MTEDDHNHEIGKAVRKYSENKGRAACLERRLCEFRKLLQRFDTEGPQAAMVRDEIAEWPHDPCQDVRDLNVVLRDQADLKDFFVEHNLDVT